MISHYLSEFYSIIRLEEEVSPTANGMMVYGSFSRYRLEFAYIAWSNKIEINGLI